MSISNAVLECVRILAPTQIDKTLSSSLRQDLADILVRLKIWAGNVGVFAPDSASVDYRLRDDKDLIEVVFSMIRKLKQSLSQAIHPPLLEESGGEDEDEKENEGVVADPGSSGSSSASLDLDSSVEESDSGNDLEGLGPSAIFIEEANNVINRLYRLTAVIRKPVSSSENAKIRGFMKKQNEKGDVEELADVEDHSRCHIKAHFPQAPEFLVNRLIEAVVFRRMKIRYRQHHQEKLKQGTEPVFAAPAPDAPYDESAETPVARATLSNLLSGKRGSIRGMRAPQPTPRSVAFSATIASSVNSARLADYAKSSALSGITKAAVGRRQKLDVPPPPNNSGKDKVVCPYCLRLISPEEMTQPRWTRHILKDIDPCVCLFEECKESLTLFKTVEEWLGHMRWQHTIVYSCQAVGHEREVFGSSQDLENHIRREHPGTFTESQIPGLVKQGAVPTSNTIGALNLSLSLNESQCLLCHTFDPKPVDAETIDYAAPGGTPEQTMQSHILEHLEAIALLALPGSGDLDGVDSDVRQSSPGSDAENKNENDDLPSAVFEDTVTERAADESVPDQDDHDHFWADVFQEVKQSRLLEPHEDPILIELGEARQKKENSKAVIEEVGPTEETSRDEDANLDKDASVTDYLRLYLDKKLRQATQQSHSEKHRSVPMLPFPVAKGFARRDGILEKIKAMFDYSSRVALVGPCGSGKTHIAEQYADVFLQEYPEANIFWVNASNLAEFKLSFETIKYKMRLKRGKRGNTMGAVGEFLKQNESGQWLMIIDGLDLAGTINDAEQSEESESTKLEHPLLWLVDSIPASHARAYDGQVLVTTRSKRIATCIVSHKYVVDVPVRLSDEDVTVLLCEDDARDSSSRPYQTKIADLLQGSAGALALVRAYKETSGAEFSWKDLLKRVQASSSEANDSGNSYQTEERVKATDGIWKPLYSQLGATHEEAACLLHILSFLDVQSIPMFLIRGYFDNESQKAEQVKALTNYGMLQISVNRRDARVTPLARLSANAMLDDASFLREAALSLVLIAYPSADKMDIIKCKLLRPCVMAALQLCSDSAELHYQRAQLLLKVAAFEKRIGRYDTASEFLIQCLDLCKAKMNAPRRVRNILEKEAERLLHEARQEQQRSRANPIRESSPVHNATEHEEDNSNDDVADQVSQEDLSSTEGEGSDKYTVVQGSSDLEDDNSSGGEEGTLENNKIASEDGPSEIGEIE